MLHPPVHKTKQLDQTARSPETMARVSRQNSRTASNNHGIVHHGERSWPSRFGEEDSATHSRLGNQAILRKLAASKSAAMLEPLWIQTKLAVNQLGDRYEMEADRVADQVVRKPSAPARITALHAEPAVQRKCACGGSCSKCQEDSLWEHDQNIQTKLTVNTIGDAFEQQADRMAEQVVSPHVLTPSAPQDGKSAGVAGPFPPVPSPIKSSLMRTHHPAGVPNQPVHTPDGIESRIAASRDAGSPLPRHSRQFMENSFQSDFANVRIHADSEANSLSHQLHAHAFTVGRDVFFASGQYQPGTPAGDRLLAHELTHVLQQGHANSLSNARSSHVQRDAYNSTYDLTPLEATTPNFVSRYQPPQADPLYFWDINDTGNTVLPICHGCHQPDEQSNFQTNRKATPRVEVTEGNIYCWAVNELWKAHVDDRRILDMLQRRQDAQLTALWNSQQVTLVNTVRSGADREHKTRFEGSATARNRFADYLVSTWNQIIDTLNGKSVDWLVDEIDAILRSGHIPGGATLITDPDTFAQAEGATVNDRYIVDHGTRATTVGVGFEWAGKRMKVVADPLVFEVIGHEGIYFNISKYDFEKTEPAMAHFAAAVAEGTSITSSAGSFIKGFLNGLAAPVKMAGAVAGNVVDGLTQAQAAFYQWIGIDGYPYTCWGPVCREYTECTDVQHRNPQDCKNDAQEKALKEATIILPLYEEGRDCVRGDKEACGGIASIAFGLAAERLGKLSERDFEGTLANTADAGASHSEVEFEEEQIREEIDRPRPRDRKLPRKKRKTKPADEPKEHAADLPAKPKTPPLNAREAAAAADELAKRNAVVKAATSGNNRLKLSLDGEEHGVAPFGKGKDAGFIMCSDTCPFVALKLDELKEVLPKDSDLFHDVENYRKHLRILDAELKDGSIRDNAADNAAAEIVAELRKYAGKDPALVRILKMSPDEIRSNRAALRKELAASPKINDSAAARDARTKAAEQANAAKKQPRGTDPRDQAAIDKDPGTSKTPGKTALSTASKEHPLEQDVTANIDEIDSVGGTKDIKEARRRALSLDDREFLEAPTNQKVKWTRERVDLRDVLDRIAGKKPRKRVARKSVSISMQEIRDGKVTARNSGEYGALWGRTFGEIDEVRTIGERIVEDMKDKDTRSPGDLKNELNSRLWDEFRNPKTPEGRAVADAIERSGFGVVDVGGNTVLRALTAKELTSRGFSFVRGQGWIKRKP